MFTVFFVGPKMIYCRKNAGLKVAEMAALLELEQDEYSAWEIRSDDPPLNILYKFARCFNVPLEDLLDDEMDIVMFERKYDSFHFAEFRERRAFLERFYEENHITKKISVDSFIKPKRFYSEKKKADVYYD